MKLSQIPALRDLWYAVARVEEAHGCAPIGVRLFGEDYTLWALAGGEAEQPYDMFWEFSRRVTIEDKVVLEEASSDFPTTATEEVHLRCDRVTLELRRQLERSLDRLEARSLGEDGPLLGVQRDGLPSLDQGRKPVVGSHRGNGKELGSRRALDPM